MPVDVCWRHYGSIVGYGYSRNGFTFVFSLQAGLLCCFKTGLVLPAEGTAFQSPVGDFFAFSGPSASKASRAV